MLLKSFAAVPSVGKEDTKQKTKLDKSSEKFVKKFKLPKSEKLLKEFDVAWLPQEADSTPLEGKLFIGETFICFLGNGFAFQTKTVTSLAEVSRWSVSCGRLCLRVDGNRYIYVIQHEEDIEKVDEILSNYGTNRALLESSMSRKESWVLKQSVDPVAAEAFNLQDCILLLDCSERRVFKQNDVIINPEDKTNNLGMWKIASGRVKLVKNDTVISVLGKNSFFGEIGFFFPKVSATASIIALDEVVEVFYIEGEKLMEHIKQYPNFGARFYKYIATIAAHRFNRFHHMFLSQFADYIYRQDPAVIIINSGNESQTEDLLLQLNKHDIKFSTSQGDLGRVSLADIVHIDISNHDNITITTNYETILTIMLSEIIRNQWILGIDTACFLSYDTPHLDYKTKKELLMKTYKSSEDCEIQFFSAAGTLEEQWFYNPLRGVAISLAINRDAQCNWNGSM